MPIKAVQQFMLGTVLNNEQQAKETLAAMKAAGYDGIELCGFMIHPIGFVVKLLTKAAGMPVGKGGNLDWHKLVQEAGRKGDSLHMDLCLPAAQELNLNPSLLTGFLEEKFGLPAASANILRTKFLTADRQLFV